jgi:hypothetical protein
MRLYRDLEPGPRPAALDTWTFRFGRWPYEHLEPVWNVTDLTERLSNRFEPPRGPILVAEPGEIDPGADFEEVAWLRGALPWLALVVVVPEPGQTDPLGSADGGVGLEP